VEIVHRARWGGRREDGESSRSGGKGKPGTKGKPETHICPSGWLIVAERWQGKVGDTKGKPETKGKPGIKGKLGTHRTHMCPSVPQIVHSLCIPSVNPTFEGLRRPSNWENVQLFTDSTNQTAFPGFLEKSAFEACPAEKNRG
jgi:hypothetical protein